MYFNCCNLFTRTVFEESSWTVWFCDCSSLCRKDIWNCLVWYDCWRNLQDRLENWFQMYCGILDCRKGFVCDTAIRNAIENENSIALRSLWEGFSICQPKMQENETIYFWVCYYREGFEFAKMLEPRISMECTKQWKLVIWFAWGNCEWYLEIDVWEENRKSKKVHIFWVEKIRNKWILLKKKG